MPGIVAIIGRPNVGKSTLFNRIIGRRAAITDNIPGVTRDRIYGETEWNGKRFILVDTGGFVPDSNDKLVTAVREQASLAIAESDLLLFVLDSHDGLTNLDKELAGILRKSDKKIITIANKVDESAHEENLHQFFALGLGDPIGVSAQFGRNTGDLLDRIVELLPDCDIEPKETERIHIAIIGQPNVGKSTLLNALTGSPKAIVTDIPGTTRDPVDSLIKYKGDEYVLIDSAGLKRRSKMKESLEYYSSVRTLRSIDRSNVAVLLVDAVQGLRHHDFAIIQEAVRRKKGIVLALNKWDMVDREKIDAESYRSNIKEKLRLFAYIPVVLISALNNKKTDKVLEKAKEVHAERGKKIGTSTLNKVIQNAVTDVHPPSVGGRDLTIKYTTQVKQNPPVFIFFSNHPHLIPEAYRRYLENRIRSEFGFTGVPLTLIFKKK